MVFKIIFEAPKAPRKFFMFATAPMGFAPPPVHPSTNSMMVG